MTFMLLRPLATYIYLTFPHSRIHPSILQDNSPHPSLVYRYNSCGMIGLLIESAVPSRDLHFILITFDPIHTSSAVRYWYIVLTPESKYLKYSFPSWDDIFLRPASKQGSSPYPVGLPYCAGYACGYLLIKHYLKKT